MRVIAKPKWVEFWQRHPAAKQALQDGFDDAGRARWTSPQDIKRRHASAGFVADNRVAFNIRGNDDRLVVAGACRYRACYIKLVGVHAQYNAIDAITVEPKP